MDYKIIFPEDFDEYLWEYQAKGRIANVIVEIGNQSHRIEVYDTTRFIQDINDEILDYNYLFFKNLIIVERIDKARILEAIENLFLHSQL